jgi:hypothetical protein
MSHVNGRLLTSLFDHGEFVEFEKKSKKFQNRRQEISTKTEPPGKTGLFPLLFLCTLNKGEMDILVLRSPCDLFTCARVNNNISFSFNVTSVRFLNFFHPVSLASRLRLAITLIRRERRISGMCCVSRALITFFAS